MKTNIKHESIWWHFIETCDRCGRLIQTHNTKQTSEPDVEEADFCYKCLIYFLDNDISYKNVKQKYRR